MKDHFFEILAVLAYSTRTQAAVVLGVVSFVVIHIVGVYALDNFQLTGPMSSLTDVIKEKFAHSMTRRHGQRY
jgi:hypothetical protein